MFHNGSGEEKEKADGVNASVKLVALKSLNMTRHVWTANAIPI